MPSELFEIEETNKDSLDVSVIIPAYGEEAVIAPVVKRIHKTMIALDLQYEVMVINDGSQDATAQVAGAAGARVISHPYNLGNGAAVKTGIRNAYGKTLVLMDGDGQHNPEDIPLLLEGLKTYDMVVGARNKETEAAVHRNLANSIYNLMASYVCGRPILDLTSGFRAIRAKIAREFLGLLPNTFSYPTTITLAVVRSGYSLNYVPIKALRRTGKSKIQLLRDGARFLIIIFKITTLFSPLKVFIPASLAMFLLGFGYGLLKVLVFGERYGPTSAMLMTISGVVFLIGLVSEQITQMRYS
jgi:glycosyltransferase involved in cell wall biosynthesis